jgi:hypothetical protein
MNKNKHDLTLYKTIFYYRKNIAYTWTLPPMVGQNHRHIIFVLKMTFFVLAFFHLISCGQDNNKNKITTNNHLPHRQMILTRVLR